MKPDYKELKIQKDVISLLKNLSYKYLSPEETENLRGNNLRESLLKPILREQLMKINSYEYKGKEKKFSPEKIEKFIEVLEIPMNEGLITVNQKIYDSLILGESMEELQEDGNKMSFQMKFIDWENPKNNIFHVTEEFSLEKNSFLETESTCRPDIVLFINGIPLGVIELKSCLVNTDEGISQMIRNQSKEYADYFFKYIQIVMAGNATEAKYATVNTPKKFWSVWVEEEKINYSDYIKNRMVTKLDKDVCSIFSPDRFLEMIYSYIIFDKNEKKIARYQQYFAIKEVEKRIEEYNEDSSRKGGLVWHTQGSGKSLTMVMLARVLMRKINNPRIILVTDRKDLDSQIAATFQHSGFKDVLTKAESGKDLLNKIRGSKKQVITTVVNKFETVSANNMVIDDKDIFILVDESHRTQYGSMNRSMRKVFPKACYIGFTGTPLLKENKTQKKFGELIHKYTIEQAIKDKSVLPLLYEGRLVEQWINDKRGLDRKFELISKNLEEEEKEDLKSKWARFQRIASSERRLEVIAYDINEHFKKQWKNKGGFKGMLATNSKSEAIKYYRLFEDYGDIKTAFIISPPDMREGHEEVDDELKNMVQREWKKILDRYKDGESYEESMKDEFKYGDEIDLLIVVDKLLTGFDATRAVVLYVDKELKDHSLLQAIARVNRLHDGKEYGYVIDYRGLLGNLDKALTSYQVLARFDEEDLKEAVFDIRNEIDKLEKTHSSLNEFFELVKNKMDREEYEVFLDTKEKREEFYKRFTEFSKKLKLCYGIELFFEKVPEEKIKEYKVDMKFFYNLRNSIRIRYSEVVDFGKYEDEMQKLMDTYISAGDVNKLTKVINIFDVESFDDEVTRINGNRAKADTIRNAIDKVISEKYENNPVYYDKLSEKIKKILENYMDKRISEDEYLKSMESVLRDVRDDETETKTEYPEEIANDKGARAIYENIIEDICSDSVEEYIVVKMSAKFSDIFNEYTKKPDWANNLDVRNEIEQKINDELWEFSDEYKTDVDSDRLTEKIVKIGLRNYSKD